MMNMMMMMMMKDDSNETGIILIDDEQIDDAEMMMFSHDVILNGLRVMMIAHSVFACYSVMTRVMLR